MIKKLQKKIITITMVSVLIVLSVILGVIDIVNFENVKSSNDNVIKIIADNNGVLPDSHQDKPDNNLPSADDDTIKKDNVEHKMPSPETPFDTRYFVVFLDSENNITSVNLSKIASVSEDEAEKYAESIIKTGKTNGLKDNFNYKSVSADDYKMIVFVDCSKELNTYYSFLISGFEISALGVILVFVLSVFLSKIAIKPIETGYEKQKQFITDASHELKTPLTVIDANTEIIEMENGESQWTKSIKSQTSRLAKLTEGLVTLAQMDESGNKLQQDTFDLSELCNEICYSFEPLAKSGGKTFDFKIQNDVKYKGNEDSINRMFSVLLENAFKYSDDNGKISFIMSKSNKKIKIRVYNSVVHIEKGEHNEFFERFYRADGSRNSKTGGFGIGLSVVYETVNAHKGKIVCISNDENSVEFNITL